MVSTNSKTRRNRSLTTRRHTVGGASPPEVISAQAQDDLEEWFPLGITYALVVRKRRGLRWQIRRVYQDRSISALVYCLQAQDQRSTPISSFKARLQDPKIPSSYTREEVAPKLQKLPAKPRLFKTSICKLEIF
jgi:hypothetical protein